MEDTSATLNGECAPWPAKERLASILREAGLEIYVGPYSVQVRNDPGFSFSFEHYGGDICDPMIAADADDANSMIRGGKLVSAALTTARIRHRFEVYDWTDRLVEYLHYDWPMPSNISLGRTRER
jgi:hypothetical protein